LTILSESIIDGSVNFEANLIVSIHEASVEHQPV